MNTLLLHPRDPETDPPSPLEDVFVFGRLDEDGEDDWHIGYRTVRSGARVWRLTDASDPPLTFHRVIAWAAIPGDPRGRPSLEVAA